EMAAGGMARDEDLIRTATIVGNVLPGPGEGTGHVCDMVRMADAGRETIVDRHRADAVPGPGPGQDPVHAKLVLVAMQPGPAMHEENHREVFLALWNID